MTKQQLNKDIANKLRNEFIDVLLQIIDHYQMVKNNLERPDLLKEELDQEERMASKLFQRIIDLSNAITSLWEFIHNELPKTDSILNERIKRGKLISRIIYGGLK
jgi:hypothetical protein